MLNMKRHRHYRRRAVKILTKCFRLQYQICQGKGVPNNSHFKVIITDHPLLCYGLICYSFCYFPVAFIRYHNITHFLKGYFFLYIEKLK